MRTIVHPSDSSVPSLLALPVGCKFSDRCRHVFDKCREAEPPLLGAPAHLVRCWLYEETT